MCGCVVTVVTRGPGSAMSHSQLHLSSQRQHPFVLRGVGVVRGGVVILVHFLVPGEDLQSHLCPSLHLHNVPIITVLHFT